MNVLTSSYFSRILRKICYILVKKISRSETWTNVVKAIGKHRVQKKHSISVEDFATIFYDNKILMAQNNNGIISHLELHPLTLNIDNIYQQ